MSEAFVLDASALLCLLRAETGSEEVAEVLPQSVISAVNLSEVYAKLAEAGGSEAQITQAVGVLRLAIEPFDDEQARIAGILRLPTRSLGLSLGDRACLALAKQRQSVAVTTDRAWSRLPADLGLTVRIIR
ncbi:MULTISPECIES: type II toxin-antitoxin system VapC family toxin [unclassified Methylobacterium]|uniref:type II toxin-antitoxin system VapC family toxin n=1 Tax=unclassified Methylobacterium TaxID=2615210 RepID=UPI001FB8D0D4|nr:MULTISPECIES: type II toxin-antitoxin system VapC family toxin [unclassified Methylobacterium]MCJ2095432.1 type II toxin-antitoxin system VapC family toxin [Methylobacterium sp. J-072]MCJ2139237.1 type II toxin-antitoxin system VapC family toxin [Methylobacterium sp. E-066]